MQIEISTPGYGRCIESGDSSQLGYPTFQDTILDKSTLGYPTFQDATLDSSMIGYTTFRVALLVNSTLEYTTFQDATLDLQLNIRIPNILGCYIKQINIRIHPTFQDAIRQLNFP